MDLHCVFSLCLFCWTSVEHVYVTNAITGQPSLWSWLFLVAFFPRPNRLRYPRAASHTKLQSWPKPYDFRANNERSFFFGVFQRWPGDVVSRPCLLNGSFTSRTLWPLIWLKFRTMIVCRISIMERGFDSFWRAYLFCEWLPSFHPQRISFPPSAADVHRSRLSFE